MGCTAWDPAAAGCASCGLRYDGCRDDSDVLSQQVPHKPTSGEAHLVACLPVAQRLHACAAICAVEMPHAIAVCVGDSRQTAAISADAQQHMPMYVRHVRHAHRRAACPCCLAATGSSDAVAVACSTAHGLPSCTPGIRLGLSVRCKSTTCHSLPPLRCGAHPAAAGGSRGCCRACCPPPLPQQDPGTSLT